MRIKQLVGMLSLIRIFKLSLLLNSQQHYFVYNGPVKMVRAVHPSLLGQFPNSDPRRSLPGSAERSLSLVKPSRMVSRAEQGAVAPTSRADMKMGEIPGCSARCLACGQRLSTAATSKTASVHEKLLQVHHCCLLDTAPSQGLFGQEEKKKKNQTTSGDPLKH